MGTIGLSYTFEQTLGDTIMHFIIEDTGIGMTLEETQRLFKPFSQANSQISSKYGGSGLGLKISKQLM